jgi:surface protein
MKKNLPAILALVFYCQYLSAQNFITKWNLSIAGSGATQITFGTITSGTANYTWQELSPGSSSGSGSWSGSSLTIAGLPAGATIRLQINPANFYSIILGGSFDANRLLEIEQWGSTAWNSFINAFLGCTNLQVTASDIPDLSGVYSLRDMFNGCATLNSPANINSWDVSTITNMSNMFNGANAFNQDISNWNTVNVTDMSYMFNSAYAFNQDISNWNTSSVTNMNSMFYGASAFNQPTNNWNTAAVTDMSDMFNGASAFNQPIGNWNTAAVTDMSGMFNGASAFNQPIGNWNTAAVTDMSGMFKDASAFNQPIGNWNTAAVTDMSGMFKDASAFNQNIGNWTLNPGVNLNFMLDNCGMDCNNYSSTLIGWNANPSTPNGRSLGASGRQYGTNAVAARTNLTGPKGWTITGDAPSGTVCSSTLPVTWLYVNGNMQNGQAIIKWATATEYHTDKFEIDHSTDGINYQPIGTKQAAAFSNTIHHYSFTHSSPAIGNNYYRIKEWDLDGSYNYSSVVLLRNTNNQPKITLSPNPVVDQLQVFCHSVEIQYIQVMSINGRVLLSQQVNKANSTHTINLAYVPAGMYVLRLITSTETSSYTFIKK